MQLIGLKLIAEFSKKHLKMRNALSVWVELVRDASWSNHSELKSIFPSADYVGSNSYIFNIGGNKGRIYAVVVFKHGKVLIEWIGTHEEYNKKKFN